MKTNHIPTVNYKVIFLHSLYLCVLGVLRGDRFLSLWNVSTVILHYNVCLVAFNAGGQLALPTVMDSYKSKLCCVVMKDGALIDYEKELALHF